MQLITGGTGFLGRQALARLLLSEAELNIALVVRPRPGEDTKNRVRDVLSSTLGSEDVEPFLSRIRIIEGDVTISNFGLGESEFLELASETTSVLHSAADTSLDVPLEDARRINVGGTANVLEFATKAKALNSSFSRLYHVSTAFVAGDTSKTVAESDLSLNADFRNHYERSKAEAEALLRAQEEVAYTVFRPSVIVGDSVSGQTSAFNVIYVPARFLAKGVLRAVPALPNTPFDVVPVDYVSDAMLELRSMDSVGNFHFHLTAGIGRESSPKEIIDAIFQSLHRYIRLGRHKPPIPPWLSPESIGRLLHTITFAAQTVRQLEGLVANNFIVLRQMLPFIPYMLSNPRFDCTETQRALGERIGEAPLFSDYAGRIFDFCLQTNWGRRPWSNPENIPPLSKRIGGLA